MERNIQFSPVVPSDRRSRHIIVKDPNDPKCTIGASLQGLVIVVHWRDGFTHDEAEETLSEWWPGADEIFEASDD